MTQSGENDNGSQVHGGHELEAGMLERVREWTDLFPWLRLARVLRIAASPTLLLVVAATLFVWAIGMRYTASDASISLLRQPSFTLLQRWTVMSIVWTVFV